MSIVRKSHCLLFVVLLVISPWAIAGNFPFAKTAFLIPTILALLLSTASVLRQSASNDSVQQRFPYLLAVLLLLGIGFTGFQMTELSGFLKSNLHSNASVNLPPSDKPDRLIEEVSEVEDNVTHATNYHQPVSIYPAATRSRLVDLTLVIGVFAASVILLSEKSLIRVIVGTLAATGVVFGFLGIVQKLSGNGKVLWNYELLSGGKGTFASFVNGNSAAGYLLMVFSAAIFFTAHQLMVWSRSQETAGLTLAGPDWESEIEQRRSLTTKFMDIVARLEPQHLYFVTAVAVIVAGIFATLSRSGMMSLILSTAVVFFFISRVNKWLSVLLVICMLLGGVGILSFSEQTEAITREVNTLNDIGEAA